ncbi:MAG: cation-translocating P-type ATPase [Anaerolineae bacterium]|nr:cation-translocating P-type ATPase [Anaerolineae bacterium]
MATPTLVKTATPSPTTPTPTVWHTLEVDQVLSSLTVNPAEGLDPAEIKVRQEKYGTNELVEKPLKSPLAILWEQITGPLVLLLIGAAIISGILGKWDSVIAIMAIVIINAILGVVQEYRAEQAMAALKKMAAPLVRVRRGERVIDVEARDLVPGDVVLLEAGSIVPADSRLYETANLRVMEASLTGESEPVEKDPSPIEATDAPLGDRHNMVYMGTSVTYGRGNAIVVETGMQTQLGRIATLIQDDEDEETPLQRRMKEVGKALLAIALVVMVIAGIIGLIEGEPVQDVLINAVAIAVAVVPEGLPAVVTIALALGAQRMLRRRALIRKLPAVETLGSVTTICSDKTGTLTENKMTVVTVDVAGKSESIHEAIKDGVANLMAENKDVEAPDRAQGLMLVASALCNDAILERGESMTDFKAVGDPTEGALVIAAAKFGLLKSSLEQIFPRVGEVPFDSDRKRMSTAHTLDTRRQLDDVEEFVADQFAAANVSDILFTKGAVDSLLEVADRVWIDNQILPMTPASRERITAANNDLAKNGLRVLGVALRALDELPHTWTPEAVEQNLVFVGMVGIIDPPRAEVKQAVLTCREAGIRPVMITGDHPLTALNIAKQLNIANEGDRVMTGQELSALSQAELEGTVEKVSVYARVSPENKLQIVRALQKKGHIVAMTGDGVNDAPALKRSDIGVAMGITGTAVSKEASDMVILDDNFATIVSAVEEGRTIYENVRRFIKYLLASNTGELFVLLSTQLAGLALPLTTLQILWMNLITDGVPALALGVEGSEKGGMKRAPYPPTESIFARGMSRHIILIGLVMGITGLALGLWAHGSNQLATNGNPAWNTMVFIFLTIAQMGHAYGLRSHRETVFRLNFFGNKLLLGAIVVTLAAQLLATYLPFFNQIFGTNPLTLGQLAICLVLSTVVFWVVEFEKLLMRRGVLK